MPMENPARAMAPDRAFSIDGHRDAGDAHYGAVKMGRVTALGKRIAACRSPLQYFHRFGKHIGDNIIS